MNYGKYLAELEGSKVWIEETDGVPMVTIWLDDSEGDRGEVVKVGDDFIVLRYKRRLRRDIILSLPLSMVRVIRDA